MKPMHKPKQKTFEKYIINFNEDDDISYGQIGFHEYLQFNSKNNSVEDSYRVNSKTPAVFRTGKVLTGISHKKSIERLGELKNFYGKSYKDRISLNSNLNSVLSKIK